MYPNQPNFGGQNNAGTGGAPGDFGGFGMSGGAGTPGMNPSMNSGGDIVFTSAGIPEKKSKKKFIIMGIVVGVLVVLLVVLALVFSRGGSGGLFGGGAPAGFNELREFIEKGDAETQALFEDGDGEESSDEENTEGDSGESEYIMAIRISEQGETEVRKYYAKLAKLEQEFYNKSATKVDSELLAEYGNALKVLRNAINYYEAKEGLILSYENGGESGAEAYFGENISCNKDSGDLKDVCSLEEKYYTAVLTEHKVYAEAGCYKNNEYDTMCVKNYYGVVEFEIKRAEDGYALEFLNSIYNGSKGLSMSILQLNIDMVEGK
ncbi:hypothetical protein IJH23_01975 [Candidatus Saccharibacteria bacterium]|nr:hypothetical protein [Candidatus Saccharibacteria bacterium]